MPSIKTDTLPPSIQTIELTPLFNIFFAVKPPIKFGHVPDGERQTGFISGGEF